MTKGVPLKNLPKWKAELAAARERARRNPLQNPFAPHEELEAIDKKWGAVGTRPIITPGRN